MGIAKLLKDGIQNEDWDKIREAYEELTGDSLVKTPKAETSVDEEGGDDYIHKISDGPRQPKKRVAYDEVTGEEKNYGVTTSVNKNKIKTVGNLFNANEFDGLEKDTDIRYDKPPVPRTRPKPKYVKVSCERCNRKYEVAPLFIREGNRYVCDRCIGNMRER